MAKSLLYRLAGVGRLPPSVVPQLQSEGILVADEGVKSSVTYIDFRAPGKRDGWRRQWFPASIALTNMRLVAFWYSNPVINVPISDERLKKMRFSLDNDGLGVAFDAGLFHPDWSGTIEYRFRTTESARFLESLQRHVG